TIQLNSASKRSWVTFSCFLFIAAKCQLVQTQAFKSFLGVNGKPVVEYEVREVRRTERDAYGSKLRKNGETTVRRLANEGF
ncbi:MAG: hypothetical protein V7L13_00690, partial [Nostoc sp.]